MEPSPDTETPPEEPWRPRVSLVGRVLILWRAVKRTLPSRISLIAAGVAFYGLLAAFPAIAALMALAGLFTDPDAIVDQLSAAAEVLPDEAATILLSQAQGVAGQSSQGLSLTLWLGVGFAIYVLTRATTSMMYGLNIAFETEEKRGILRYWFTTLCLTTALLFGVVFVLVLLVGLPTLLAFLPIDIGTAQLIRALRWVLVVLVFVTGLSAFYRWAPSRRRTEGHALTYGAMIGSLLWFAGSMGFATYVANFGNYNETFGSLGGVNILLTWLWLSAFIILFGGIVDAETEAYLAALNTTPGVSDGDAIDETTEETVVSLADVAAGQSRPVP